MGFSIAGRKEKILNDVKGGNLMETRIDDRGALEIYFWLFLNLVKFLKFSTKMDCLDIYWPN